MFRETAEQRAEADRLAAVVALRAEALHAASRGRSFILDGVDFRLFVKNRNTIYRAQGEFPWFVKLLPPADRDVMPRESLGVDFCRSVLGACDGYAGPFVTRVSANPPFVLASALEGPPLTRVLVRGAWSLTPSDQLVSVFSNLGMLLGRLHADTSLPPDAPIATKRPFEVARKLAERLSAPDETIREVIRWTAIDDDANEDSTFIHGNLRLDNLLVCNGRIGFVDFENCGRGPSYQDLSRPITQLLLLKASIAGPGRRVDRCVREFLSSYRDIRPYDSQSLGRWVAIRLARYYLESHGRRRPGLIGGLPVLRKRLGAMTRRLMAEGLDSVTA